MSVDFVVASFYVLAFVFFLMEAVVPGFGIFGFFSLGCLSAGLFLMLGAFDFFLFFASVFAGFCFLVWLLSSYFSESCTVNPFILKDRLPFSEETFSQLPGMEGEAVTVLRPSGVAKIGGRRLNVSCDCGFLPVGSRVIVTKVELNRIYVSLAPEK